MYSARATEAKEDTMNRATTAERRCAEMLAFGVVFLQRGNQAVGVIAHDASDAGAD